MWYGYICLSHFYLLLKQFLQGIKDLRCRMVTWFYLISTFFFEHFLQGTMDLMYRIVFFFNLIFSFFFRHFLPGIIGLRCRMVTFSYLSFTFFFEHFLQGTMDPRHRLITSPQRHLTNSLQTACGHLTIFASTPIRRVGGGFGGGYGVTYLLRTFNPPSLNVNLPGHGFWRGV